MSPISNILVCAVAAFALLLGQSQGAQLSDWRAGSNYFSFHLLCESNEYYLVQYSTNLTNWADWRYVDGRSTNRATTVPNGGPIRFWQAVRTPEPMFAYALKAKENIEFTNRLLFIDSYDSSNPAYSTAARYDPTKAIDKGDVAARNDAGTNTLVIENTVIKGTVVVGSNGAISIGTNAVVGDALYDANPANRGTIQPGHWLFDTNVSFPNAVLPAGTAGWAPFPSPANIIVDGTVYKYVLANLDYYVSPPDGFWSASTFIQGNVRIRVDSGISFTGSGGIRLGTNATLQIFANCPTVYFGGVGIRNDGIASAFQYFGTVMNTSVQVNPNSEVDGIFYAPSADMVFGPWVGGVIDFSGSFVGRSIRIQRNTRIHFDEALKLLPWPQ